MSEPQTEKSDKIVEKGEKTNEKSPEEITEKMASITTVPISNLQDSVEHEVKVTLAEGITNENEWFQVLLYEGNEWEGLGLGMKTEGNEWEINEKA